MIEWGPEMLGVLEGAILHEYCEQVDGSDYVPVSMLILAIRELKAAQDRIRELEQEFADILAWCGQSQQALTSRQVADAVMRMCQDVLLPDPTPEDR